MSRRAKSRLPKPKLSSAAEIPRCSRPRDAGGDVPCDRYAKYKVDQGGQTQYLCDWHYESFLLFYEGQEGRRPAVTPV